MLLPPHRFPGTMPGNTPSLAASNSRWRMNMKHLYGMAVLTGLLLVGCSETRQEAGEASREVGAAANRDREEYQRRMENRLDQMDRQVEEMKAKAQNAT